MKLNSFFPFKFVIYYFRAFQMPHLPLSYVLFTELIYSCVHILENVSEVT